MNAPINATNDFLTQYMPIIAPLIISSIAFLLTMHTNNKLNEAKLKNIEGFIDESRKENKELRDKVIACEAILKERGPTVTRQSPLSLTERGKKILNDSSGKTFIDEYLNEFIEKIKEKTPKSAYDVQEESMNVLRMISKEDRFIPLKDYLFKEGLDLDELILIIGIYLRDLALPRLGFKLEEIDKTDPNKTKSK